MLLAIAVEEQADALAHVGLDAARRSIRRRVDVEGIGRQLPLDHLPTSNE